MVCGFSANEEGAAKRVAIVRAKAVRRYMAHGDVRTDELRLDKRGLLGYARRYFWAEFSGVQGAGTQSMLDPVAEWSNGILFRPGCKRLNRHSFGSVNSPCPRRSTDGYRQRSHGLGCVATGRATWRTCSPNGRRGLCRLP